MIVELDWIEMKIGAEAGVLRRISGIIRGRTEKNGTPQDNAYDRDVNGALAELAVAKALNLHWSGACVDYTVGDVGGMVEVRAINKAHHRLFLYRSDAPAKPFVLVFCKPPRFTLRGWMFAEQGKQEPFWEEGKYGRPAFYPPNDQLRPMDELTAWLRERRDG